MIISMCGSCGWLGGSADLKMAKGIDDSFMSNLAPLMEGNRDASYVSCPNCDGFYIFYKSLNGGEVSLPISPIEGESNEAKPLVVKKPQETHVSTLQKAEPTVSVEPKPTETNNDSDNQPPMLESELIPPPEVDANGKAVRPGKASVTQTNRRISLFKCVCDVCHRQFDTKVQGSTQCDECTGRLVKG